MIKAVKSNRTELISDIWENQKLEEKNELKITHEKLFDCEKRVPEKINKSMFQG